MYPFLVCLIPVEYTVLRNRCLGGPLEEKCAQKIQVCPQHNAETVAAIWVEHRGPVDMRWSPKKESFALAKLENARILGMKMIEVDQ